MRTRPKGSSRNPQQVIQIWSGTFMIALSIFVFATIPEKQANGISQEGSSELISLLFWNLGHVFGFALFTGLLTLAINATRKQSVPDATTSITAILVTAAFALLTEILQNFVPGRKPAISDIGLDLIGAFIGLLFAVIWRKTTSGGKARFRT